MPTLTRCGMTFVVISLAGITGFIRTSTSSRSCCRPRPSAVVNRVAIAYALVPLKGSRPAWEAAPSNSTVL